MSSAFDSPVARRGSGLQDGETIGRLYLKDGSMYWKAARR